MKYLIATLLLALSIQGISQDFRYLEEIRLKKKAHFTEHEGDMIKAVDYLLNSPIDSEDVNRTFCVRFVVRYAEKTPFATVVIGSSLIKIAEENSDLIWMFMGIWVKSTIQNENQSESTLEEHSFTQLSNYCSKGNGVVKTETVKSLMKAVEKDELAEWINALDE